MTALAQGLVILHLAFAVAALGVLAVRLAGRKGWRVFEAGFESRWQRFLLVACLVAPLFLARGTATPPFEPLVKIMESHEPVEQTRAHRVALPAALWSVTGSARSFPATDVWWLLAVFLGGSVIFGSARFVRDLVRLRSLLKNSVALRRIGPVTIAVSDQLDVPCSAWWGRAWVLLPPDSLASRELLRTAVLHELQHHRQGDTRWAYAQAFAGAALGFSPLWKSWARASLEIQEISCDKNLVDHGKVERREYARRLIDVAETAVRGRGGLVCAPGMASNSDRHLISRRIEAMYNSRKVRPWGAIGVAVLSTAVVSATAWASSGLVVDRRVSMSEARRMAEIAREGTTFPVPLNPEVVRQLNRYLGTESGRRFTAAALERLPAHRAVLEKKMREYRVPLELLAVPFVESGFTVAEPRDRAPWTAGMWQFIVSTARNFGLRVDERTDERLNVEKDTDAALRYLLSNYHRFRDWQLALLAYNMGETAVQRAIDKTGSRDAWTLIRAGHEGDRDYLARVMAGVIVLKNEPGLK